jgi:hypothetical protein
MANAADNPKAFLNMARQYQKAASRLLDSVAEEPKEGPQEPLSDPIYFLYFQTVELALKAFLLFHGEKVPTKGQDGHDIVELHRRCGALGLRHADPMGLGNIVYLLASGHEEQGFRYFSLKGGAIPDLSWTREMVDLLIQSLREVVVDDEGSDEAVKVQILVGKPYERPKGS